MIVRIFSGKEVITEVLSREGIPEASSSECIEGVHLVLKALLIIIDLFEIINDFNIAFNGGLFLARSLSFLCKGFFLPLLLILAVFFA